MPVTCKPTRMLGAMRRVDGQADGLPGGAWFVGQRWADAVGHRCMRRDLKSARFASVDVLLRMDSFCNLALQAIVAEGGGRVIAETVTAPLPDVSMRLVLTLPAEAQRESIVEFRVMVHRKPAPPVHVCLTPIALSAERPAPLNDPVLPKGPLLDEFGQLRTRTWQGKTRSERQLIDRLERLWKQAPQQRWPRGFSRWGGSQARRVKASGFFRTHHDGKRWWLVDPDGHLFWSAGPNCAHPTIPSEAALHEGDLDRSPLFAWLPPRKGAFASVYSRTPYVGHHIEHVNFMQANFIRAFGAGKWHEAWRRISHAQLRRAGFNTAGDWSDEAAASRSRLPYVRPLDLEFAAMPTPAAAPCFPDPFHPDFERHAVDYARPLRRLARDPAMIGYFLTNEPPWSAVAATMLRQTPSCPSRVELEQHLRRQYGGEPALQSAWGTGASWRAIRSGLWQGEFTAQARADLRLFATIMIKRLVETLSRACGRAAPNHLNLGIRFAGMPAGYIYEGMHSFDVMSVNWYDRRLHPDAAAISAAMNKPIMVGEFHFGAFDAGLTIGGLYAVRDQRARGQAYRGYVEDVIAKPWCVGAHWFTMYDNSAIGRAVAGELNNCGLVDVCHRGYEPLLRAARVTHERMYDIASGRLPPFSDDPEYVFPSR